LNAPCHGQGPSQRACFVSWVPCTCS
jgi:hypothetical protein